MRKKEKIILEKEDREGKDKRNLISSELR